MAWPKGKPKPPEVREKLSKALQAYWNAPEGRDRQFSPLSQETRRKLSEAMQGRTHSDETKRKISESNKESWLGKGDYPRLRDGLNHQRFFYENWDYYEDEPDAE